MAELVNALFYGFKGPQFQSQQRQDEFVERIFSLSAWIVESHVETNHER
jgi:hypothetical protein